MFEFEKKKFVKLPKDIYTGKELKEFESMIGHTYTVTTSCFKTDEYIVCEGETEEAEKAYQDSIYKSLKAIGESEEFAKACAYEGEDPGMCLYFNKECFEEVEK